MRIIGIAGGSGSGKSTVAIALCREHPEEYALVHLDDYFKPKEEVPMQDSIRNWDHPDALRFDDLYRDLLELEQGRPITIATKSELYNPDYNRALKNKINYTIDPRQTVIVEGYLALYDSRIRELMDKKIFLDIPIAESVKRRTDNKFQTDQSYIDNFLVPMYEEYVEPTREYADLVIPVEDKTAKEVLGEIEDFLGDSQETSREVRNNFR